MKAENFANLIVTNCTTKKGDLRKSDMEMLYHIIFHPKEKRRTFMWLSKGKSFRDTHIRDLEVLTKLGIDYGYFNDAPQGGQNGNYLIITPKGYRRIKPFLKEFHKYENNKQYGDMLNICKFMVLKGVMDSYSL
jgi:hypothetical protein